MRLYFLTLTPLSEINTLTETPQEGDAILYIRRAQDPKGEASESLEKKNITTYYIDDVIDGNISKRIDALGTLFLRNWFMDDAKDFSLLGEISLGTSYSMEIVHNVSPRFLINIGEAFRLFLNEHPQATHVFSDARDGRALFETNAKFFPIAQVIEHVATHSKLEIKFLEPIGAVPSAYRVGVRYHFSILIKSFFGQFRPDWIRAHLNFRKNRKTHSLIPIIYIFIGRAQEFIVRELVERSNFHVVCNWIGIPGADSFRCDHFLALPKISDIRTVRKLLREIQSRSSKDHKYRRFEISGITYDKFLYQAVYSLIKSQIWPFLVVIAQSRKFHNRFKVSSLVINDALNEPMGNLVYFNKDTELKIYLIPHGMNLIRNIGFSPAMDQEHVTYLNYGKDHLDFFTTDSKKTPNTRRVVVGNPLTMAMIDVRSKRPSVHKKRLLVLSFGHTDTLRSDRVFSADNYYIDIFGLVPDLINEGWEVTIRPHPYHRYDLELKIADAFGVSNKLKWDSKASIEDALPHYDVVVSNLSSAFYQSLYAGWPTIFYEPDYLNTGSLKGIENDPMLTGLLTAKDLDRPVTNNPNVLAKMIRDSQDKLSTVSQFPEKFANELAPRFIGPNPANANKVIADFLENDYFGE